jgi:hypothetical protein
MAALGRVIAEAIVLEYGKKEFLRRLSHPEWQSSPAWGGRTVG